MIKLSDDEIFEIYLELVEDGLGEESMCKKALFLKLYSLLLKEEANLIRDLAKTSDTDILFAVHHYLVLNGWLSSDDKFILTPSPDELYSSPEVSICLGGGCCRHIAPHFFHILNYLNGDNKKQFHLVGTNYLNRRSKLEEVSEISYFIDDSSFDGFRSGEEYDYNYPNHIEVLSKKDNTLYDPLNFNIQRIDFFDQDINHYIGPIDLAMGLIYDSSVSSFEKQFTLEGYFYQNLSCFKRYPLSDKELIELRKIGIDICLSNLAQIKQYKEKYERSYQYVKKQAKKYTHNYLENI